VGGLRPPRHHLTRAVRLICLVVVAGCAGSDVPEPAYAAEGLGPPLHCRVVTPFPEGSPGTVTQISPSGDTALIVLFADARMVAFVGPDLQERWRLPLEREGAAGVHTPAGVAFAGDSLLYVSDARRHLVRLLSPAGEGRGTIELDFAPREIAATKAGLAALRLVRQGGGDDLLTLLLPDSARRLGPAPRLFADVRLHGLANTMSLGLSRTGELLVSHRTVVPLLYRVDPSSGAFTSHAVVVPREARGAFRPVPRLSRGQRGIEEMLIPAFAVVEAPESGDLLYAAGTGRWRDGSPEWALIRASSRMEPRGGWLLPHGVEAMALLPVRAMLVVVDEAGEWHACPVEP
jgi:hypothetical protein